MSWSVGAIRDAMKTQLSEVVGLRCYDTAPGQAAVPAAIVTPADPFIEYDQTFQDDESNLLHFQVLLLVQYGTDRVAQDNLDAYLPGAGPLSVKAALQGDLGGTVVDCSVTNAFGYGSYNFGGPDYLGCRFSVDVML